MTNGEKEEIDIGRTITLSPSEENPEQILPNVTVQDSPDSITAHESANHSTIVEEIEPAFMNEEFVSSYEKGISLESREKPMRKQEYGIQMAKEV